MDPEQDQNQKTAPTIRTMRTDAELYAKEKDLSSLQINAAEYIKQSSGGQTTDNGPSWPSNKLFIIGVIFASILILGGGSWLITSRRANVSVPPVEIPIPPSFIMNDGQIPISFKETTPLKLKQNISAERAKQFRSGALIYLPVKEELQSGSVQYASATDAIKALGLNAPTSLLEILHHDQNLFIFGNGGTNDMILIMRIVNFERAFSSMLEWEKTLARDWQLFSNEESTASLPRSFADEIIKNNDTRVLKKDDGTMIVGYAIFNKKYIIISSSRDAIKTVLERFIQLPPQ